MSEITRWRPELPDARSAGDWAGGSFQDPDFSSIIQSLRASWRLIAGITVAGAVLAFVVLQLMPQKYKASTLIMLDSRSTILDETQGIFANLPIADTYIESEIELIQSDAIVHRVIERANLIDDPEFANGNVPDDILEMVRSERSSPSKVEKATGADDLLANVKRMQIAEELRERLDVERRGLSQGILIGFESESPAKARDLANAFAEIYVLDQLDNKLGASRRATSWLRAELDKLADETQAAEKAVEDYRASHTLVGEGEQGISNQQLRSMTESLAAAKADFAAAQVKMRQLEALRAAGKSPALLPEIASKTNVIELRSELSAAEREVAQLRSRFNEANIQSIPMFQEAEAKRQAVQQSLSAEVARSVEEIKTQMATAGALIASLEGDLGVLRNENADVNAASIGLNELEREAAGKRARYEALLAEYNKADTDAATQTPHARIVSPAELPLEASSPRKKAAFGAAIIFSGALSVFIALIKDFARRSIRTPAEFHAATNMRAIGILPRISSGNRLLARAANTVVKSPSSPYAEAVRSLRVELELNGGFDRGDVVAVTSPVAGDDKTEVSTCLACSLALAGVNTLLVDADLRRPDILTQLYRKYGGPDLSAVIHGDTDWHAAVISTRIENLDILAPRRRNWEDAVSERFANKLEGLIDDWRKEYQAIVVNSPPVLAFSDARMIATQADHTLLCVQWNNTDRRLISDAIDSLRRVGAAPKAVITQVAPSQYDTFFGGNRSYYSRHTGLRVLRA
jgi:capsular exopolysaccharide synthesis family protein